MMCRLSTIFTLMFALHLGTSLALGQKLPNAKPNDLCRFASNSTTSGNSTSDAVAFQPPVAARVPREGIGHYIQGGRNVMACQYKHSEGYPPFPDRITFIGTLRGSWYEMGKQFGQRSGDAVRCVSDIWWKRQCDAWGKAETARASKLYQEQIQKFEPELIRFMEGIADGASPWLDQSSYAKGKNDALSSTNYERVLAANIHDEWSMRHPHQFPDGESTYGGSAKAPQFIQGSPLGESTEPPLAQSIACSGFSVRGSAAANGQVISAQNRHTPYDPRCYEQVYIIDPDDGIACWVLTNCPQTAANQVVNERGVSISLFAGGSTNQRSLKHEGESYYAEGFGVPWFHLFLYAGTHARNAEEAITILTKGTPGYRDKTGRKTLLRGGGWIFLVADPSEMAVVEVTADRYAVRRPGELTGSDWKDKDYIVATNHNLCDFSYDKDDRHTLIPMTIFGDGYNYDPETGKNLGLNGSGIRFWTLMWDIKHQHGKIDQYTAQQIMSGLYAYDQETGKKIEVAQDPSGSWCVWGTIKECNQGIVSLAGGTNDGKVAVLRDKESVIHWTMGSPSHWQGAWDTFRFDR